jgi:hypothetical protein
MIENRMLKRIFGPKKEEVIGGLRSELYNLHASPHITMVMKSRRMGWARHVAHMKARKMHENFFSESLKGSDNLEDIGVDGRVKVKGFLSLCFL